MNPKTLVLCFENKKSIAYQILHDFLNQSLKDWIWFNQEVNLRNNFREHLYYLTCDYRSKEYEFITREDIITIDNERLRNNEKELDGVKGQIFLFRLPYFQLTDICIEPKHALKGVLYEVVFKVMWQDRKNLRSEKTRSYYDNICSRLEIEGMFPLILNEERYPKCSLTTIEKGFVEDALKCILIPKGCKAKLKFAEFRIFEVSS